MSDAAKDASPSSLVQEAFGCVSDAVLARVFVPPQLDAPVTAAWPELELADGVAHVEIKISGDDPSVPFVRVTGTDRDRCVQVCQQVLRAFELDALGVAWMSRELDEEDDDDDDDDDDGGGGGGADEKTETETETETSWTRWCDDCLEGDHEACRRHGGWLEDGCCLCHALLDHLVTRQDDTDDDRRARRRRDFQPDYYYDSERTVPVPRFFLP